MKSDKELNAGNLSQECYDELREEMERFMAEYPKLYEVIRGVVDAAASHEQILDAHEWKLETLKVLVQRSITDESVDFDSPLSTLRPEDIN